MYAIIMISLNNYDKLKLVFLKVFTDCKLVLYSIII